MIVARASASSRSASVDIRMQPRPMRSSEASSQPGRFGAVGYVTEAAWTLILVRPIWACGSRTSPAARPTRRAGRLRLRGPDRGCVNMSDVERDPVARGGARAAHRARVGPGVARRSDRAIVADAEAAERDGAWPGHPLDDLREDERLASLYFGGAGMIWALSKLGSSLDATAAIAAALERYRAAPDLGDRGPHPPSLLAGRRECSSSRTGSARRPPIAIA